MGQCYRKLCKSSLRDGHTTGRLLALAMLEARSRIPHLRVLRIGNKVTLASQPQGGSARPIAGGFGDRTVAFASFGKVVVVGL